MPARWALEKSADLLCKSILVHSERNKLHGKTWRGGGRCMLWCNARDGTAGPQSTAGWIWWACGRAIQLAISLKREGSILAGRGHEKGRCLLQSTFAKKWWCLTSKLWWLLWLFSSCGKHWRTSTCSYHCSKLNIFHTRQWENGWYAWRKIMRNAMQWPNRSQPQQ